VGVGFVSPENLIELDDISHDFPETKKNEKDLSKASCLLLDAGLKR